MSHHENVFHLLMDILTTKEEEDAVGERFNYGINFFVCILGNLKKGETGVPLLMIRKYQKFQNSFG